MSNAQWEVVGKSKKAASNGKVKLNKEEKKKVIENAPKIEDILPLAQVKSLYNALEAAEEKKLKPKSGKENKSKETDKKPQQKKSAEKKPSEPPKPKPPKSLEAALNQINLDEFSTLVDTSQVRFANAPLVWLKELACFLNSKIAVDHNDVLFSSQPVTYPASIVPAPLKRKLELTISSAGKLNAQLFYDVSLTTLANDMNKGLPVLGHKILLQIIGQENPEFCVASVAKCNSLRNSYQNRPPIGLSLLWAFGQGGYKDLNVGLQVWEEMILPLLEFKHYSRFVINYLSKLLDTHLKKTGSKLSQEQFLHLHDLVNTKRAGLSKDLAAELVKQLPKIRTLYFERNTGVRFQVSFNQLLKKLPNQYTNSKNYEPFQKEVLVALVICLERDESCAATWRQLYNKCPKQTATLLHYINSNWAKISKKVKVKSFKSLVLSFLSANSEQGKKKDETTLALEKQCQAVLAKMKSSRSFPWLLASFFVFLAIVGVVVFDFTQSGGVFAKSKTGQALHNIGALECTQKAWQRSIATSARGYVWMENNVPVYWQSAREFSEPYAQLAYDLGIIGFKITRGYYNNIKDYLVEKGPVVYDTVESYAPGMLASVQSYACSSWDATKKFTVYYYQASADYLKSNVFIGEWAPEILQDKTLKALNSTRIYVLESYDWFHKQVDIYSKIE